MRDIYYIEQPVTVYDRIRSMAADLMLQCMRGLELFSRWEAFDTLRWWAEGHLHSLFAIWWQDTPDSLQMAANGEIPLHAISPWERSQILGFDDIQCCCIDCHTLSMVWEAENDFCPYCEGSLFLGEDWSHIPVRRYWTPEPSKPLLLTERRAA